MELGHAVEKGSMLLSRLVILVVFENLISWWEDIAWLQPWFNEIDSYNTSLGIVLPIISGTSIDIHLIDLRMEKSSGIFSNNDTKYVFAMFPLAYSYFIQILSY